MTVLFVEYNKYIMKQLIYVQWIRILKTCYTRIIKNILNKNERRCRDVNTQKACEQGWEANIGPYINKPLPYNPT